MAENSIAGWKKSYLFSDTTTGVWGIQNNRVGLISSHDNINIPTTCFTYLEKQTNKQWNKWWIISLLILTTTRQVHYLIFMGWMFLNFYCVCICTTPFIFFILFTITILQRGLWCTLHTYTHKHTFILRAFDSLSNKSNK